MSFCWFTSFIGYPNFFNMRRNELAELYLQFAQAAIEGKSYTEAKALFSLDPSQVETKKAAFQEYGLLYVVPRSNTITLTPLGRQLYDLCSNPIIGEENRRIVLLALSRALARYQFNNPLPVGGHSRRERAQSSDVLPYLTFYYLLLKLDGVITLSELRGAIFGLQHMSDLEELEATLKEHRQSGIPFPDLSSLPENPKTADNLHIYFMSHASLSSEIIKDTTASFYNEHERAYSITQLGREIIESVLNELSSEWQNSYSSLLNTRVYERIEDYFIDGIGQSYSSDLLDKDATLVQANNSKIADGILDEDEVENLKELEVQIFEEGRTRLVQHERLEKMRNPTLISEAKRLFKAKNGALFCEVCGFNFENIYRSRGKDYTEAHHKTPISTLVGPVNNTIEQLAMVCSNCHRMLHRYPWISVEELKEIIQINTDL